MRMSTLKTFAQSLIPLTTSPTALTFEVSDDWRQGRSCFGGLQAALALVAMRTLTGVAAPLRVLQTSFIGPVGDGPVTATATVLRAGKSVTHVEGRLLQNGETLCMAVGIFGAARESAIQVPMQAPTAAQGVEGLKDLPFFKGVAPNFTQHFQWRWAAGGWPYSGSVEPFTRIWLKHRAPTGTDPFAAEYAFVGLADAVPSPAISMMKTPKASSSLTWTLELLRDTPPQGDGFWRIDSDIHQARDGYVAQTALVVAPDLQPIALSRQAVVVFA